MFVMVFLTVGVSCSLELIFYYTLSKVDLGGSFLCPTANQTTQFELPAV